MGSDFRVYRQASRDEWHSTEGSITSERINVGSLQRIADAVEKMSGSYNNLIEERDRYKRWYEEERTRSKKLRNQLAGTQGHVTRLRNKLTPGTNGNLI